MKHTLRAVQEDLPGPVWQSLFERFWPAYERWFLKEGDIARPGLVEAQRQLEHHMPALVPTWARLTELAGGGERVARFLSLYRPTPYLSGCTQLAWVRGEPLLIRNYDYAPRFWEGTLLHTAWNGRRVLAMGDCLWGALDGINEAGLAVALAFGGRRVVGDGFGIPLLLRYLLEFASDVKEAAEVLQRVPNHMAYNVTVVDAAGEFFTASLAPDHPPVFHQWPIATNHQAERDWPEYAQATATLEREQYLAHLVADPAVDATTVEAAFLHPPLRCGTYLRGFGTLYTAVYAPRQRWMELRWPGKSLRFDFQTFEACEVPLALAPGDGPPAHVANL